MSAVTMGTQAVNGVGWSCSATHPVLLDSVGPTAATYRPAKAIYDPKKQCTQWPHQVADHTRAVNVDELVWGTDEVAQLLVDEPLKAYEESRVVVEGVRGGG